MNEKLKDKLVELPVTSNISYLMNDNKDFSITAYKVMQNQPNSGLVKCVETKYNGKIKLVYIVDTMKPLSLIIAQSGINELSAVIYSLIQRVIDISNNGFFIGDNIELDASKILVDPLNYSAHLIYFPITSGYTGKISDFENDFRIMLINLLTSYPVFSSPQFQHLCNELSNPTLSFRYILKSLQDSLNRRPNVGNQLNSFNNPGQPAKPFTSLPIMKPLPQQHEYAPPKTPAQPVLTLRATDAPSNFSLMVAKPEYVIGKNPAVTDGTVTYNPAISRTHCKIVFESNAFYIMDLGSANGTFVNRNRLRIQEKYKLNSGDIVTLANSNFLVEF